jgi:hypothetical protein
MHHLPSYWLLCICSLSLSACNSSHSDSTAPVRTRPPTVKRELRKVTGSFIDFDITTFIAIRCAAYEGRFINKNVILISDPVKLRAITQRLIGLHSDTIGLHMDARAKAVLFYNDQTQDTLCMGRFTCLYRGQSIRADTILYQLLGVIPK